MSTSPAIAADDVQRLAQATLALVQDPARCEQMGRAAVGRIHTDFDWERTVAAYLRVYDELLQRPEDVSLLDNENV